MKIISYLIIILSFIGHINASADDRVTTEYTYRCGLDKSPEEAKRIALERAKIEALAEKYGTTISQTNYTTVKNEGGESSIDYESISSSQVKGEWLETIGEPSYEMSIEDNMLIITVKVTGKAKEIKRASTDFKTIVSRSNSDWINTESFNSGESLYLSFESPQRGFMSCYLLADDGMAYCILPYINSSESIVKIDKDKKYLFFSPSHSENPSIVDEYTLTADKETEHNEIYLIFSPNNFSKARDESLGSGLPRGLPITEFRKWLSRQRNSDKQMQVEIHPIEIHKPL